MNDERVWKVGQLAKSTGLTVRTLHHYDELGLLSPSRRSTVGHRLYTEDDVRRLYQVCALRRIGLPLAEIAKALDDREWNLPAAMRRHLQATDRQLEIARQLRRRLAAMTSALANDNSPEPAELIETMEEMTMLQNTVQRRISMLVYEDIGKAHDYLVRVFRLGAGRIERDSDGVAIHAEVDAGDGVIWLHRVSPRFKLASPRDIGGVTGWVAVMVDDVDAHYAHAKESDATIEYPPRDMPYGVREYGARDLEGHLWNFMTPID